MKNVFLATLRLYQLSLSALIGRRCRYLPTCSDYTYQAIEKHGVGRGIKLGVARICRCHPMGSDGFDPVPEVYQGPEWRHKKGSHEAPLDS